MGLWFLLIVWTEAKYGRDNDSKDDKVLQKDLCQHTSAPTTVVVRVLTSRQATVDLCLHGRFLDIQKASLRQSLVGSLLLFPRYCYTQVFFFFCLFVCLFVLSLQEPVSPILWEFCNQIPLAFKSHWVFRVPCWVSRLGNMLWALELLQHCGNFFGVIVLQSVGCLLGGSMMELMVTSSKRTFTTCQTS